MLSQEHNTVEFDYDEAGNRILRHTIYIEIMITKADEQPDTLQNLNMEKSVPADEFVLEDMIIRIYPNPTMGRFTVSLDNLSETDQVSYSLYTLTGQLISQGQIINNETVMDIQEHENGTYLFKLAINSETTTWKVIKR
ncbi:MAG: hypothetical protein A2W85_02845 [Bacteroidetes bacterium GWF2_41_31]|nr:MAG: hypothetical protein A2W85_02845 [Bacteroidetes bacterium GWF2_41_31]